MTEARIQPGQLPAEAAEFRRFPEGQAYLEAVRLGTVSAEDLKRVVEICNQPLVLDHLKQTLTDGQPYAMSYAQDLVHVGEHGWGTGEELVYFIRNGQRRVVGNVSIKSNDPDAEVGFWADAEQPGHMTNAMECLTGLAREAGFTSLYAIVDPVNEQSAGVFRRLGWQEATDAYGDEAMLHFSHALNPVPGANHETT